MGRYTTGPGFELQMGDGATPEAFTTVAAAGDLSGPGISVDSHDVTNQDSAGHVKEKVPGAIDAGEVSFPVWFNPDDATHDDASGLYYVVTNRITKNWKMLYPDGTERWRFTGYISKFDAKQPVNGVASADTAITLSGPAVLNPGP
jgi:hypothetical protein